MLGVGECDVVVGYILFGMHFSQSKNALLLNYCAHVKDLCGQSYKHFTNVNYNPGVVIWAIF